MSLIADCFDVLLVSSDGELFGSSTLSSGDINITCDSTEVRAGRGDALISVLRGNRQVEINLSEVTFKWDFLAMQLGRDSVVGAETAWALPKWYKAKDVTGTVTIELENTPLTTDSGIKIYDADGKLVTGTVSGKKVTFTTGVEDGDNVEVRGYKYTTGANTETIEIDNVSFPDDVICILETLEISEEGETQLSKIQYIFEKAVPTGNVSISTKKEKDANVTDFALKAIKPIASGTIGKVVKIPIQ